MSTLAIVGLTGKSRDFRDWQQESHLDLEMRYKNAVRDTISIHSELKNLSLELQRYRRATDAAGRPIIWYTDNRDRTRRMKLSAIQDFREKRLAPKSKEFRVSLETVRGLHFACRAQSIPTFKEVFELLDTYGMIHRKK